MEHEIVILQEDAKKYAELYLSMKRGRMPSTYELREGYECCDGYNFIGSFEILIGLSDEDKFICALLYIEDTDRGLTTKMLNQWFGWSKYKCYKLARANNHCHTVSLVCEDGGYAGKGWILTGEINNAIREYKKNNYPCAKCKNLEECEKPGPFAVAELPIGRCRLTNHLYPYRNSGCDTGYFENKHK